MKNLKKVLALVLAFAMVISSFTTVFAAEEAQNLEKAEALHELGLFDGKSTSEFDPALLDGATREEAIKLLADAFGWDIDEDAVSPFEDVSAYAEKYVAYAFENGVTKGKSETHFGAKDPITDRQLVTLITRELGFGDAWADPSKAVEAGLIDFSEALALVSGAKEVNRDYAVGLIYATLTLEYAEGGTVIAALVEAGKVDAEVAEELGLYTPVVEKLEVVSVTADNLIEVVVEYNQNVEDNAEVKKADNYSLDIKDVKSVAVSGSTATLTLKDGVANQKTAKLTIGAKILGEKEVVAFTFLDRTLPEVLDVVVTGPKSFTINFSEPMTTAQGKVTVRSASSTLSVNNTSAKVTNAGDTSVNVELYSTFVDGTTYTISISAFEDFAGYTNSPAIIDINYVKDTTPPTAEILEATTDYVKVKFSKPVSNIATSNFSHTYTAWNAVKVTSDADGNNVATSGDVFYVWFYTSDGDTHPIPEGTTSFRISAKNASNAVIKDNWGNEFATEYYDITVTGDKAVPEVTNIEATAGNKFVVEFSKNVSFTNDNVAVTDVDGSTIDGVKIKVTELSGKKYEVDFAKDLTGKTVLVTIKNVEDKTLFTNKLVSYSTELLVKDTTKPSVINVTITDDGDAYKNAKFVEAFLYIHFDEEVTSATALTVDNYLVRAGASYLKLSGTPEFVNNERTVRIPLSESEYNTSKNQQHLVVSGVKDLAGNTIIPVEKEINNASTNRPTIETVQATATNKLVVKFSQVLNKVALDDFTVGIADVTPADSGIGQIDVTESGGKTVVTLTMQKSVIPYDAEDITVSIDDTIENEFGVPTMPINFTQIADKIAPALITVDGDNKALEIETDESNRFVIYFEENIQAPVGGANFFAYDLQIVNPDGDTLAAGIDYTTEVAGTSGIEVTLTPSGIIAGKYKVSVISGARYIKDGSGNVAAKSDAITVVAFPAVYGSEVDHESITAYTEAGATVKLFAVELTEVADAVDAEADQTVVTGSNGKFVFTDLAENTEYYVYVISNNLISEYLFTTDAE